MAHEKFRAEVLTPEGKVFDDEVEMVSTRTAVGSIGPAELRLYKSETEIVSFAQSEGYMQIAENRALLLVEEAHPPDQLDASQLRDRLQEAERRLQEAGDDTEKQRSAERDRRRWERFLKIAEG
jgi:F-type H+-transporting ATPase subunit epsilon